MTLALDEEMRMALKRRPLHKLPSGIEVVDLCGGPGHGYMMSLDGRVFEWEYNGDEAHDIEEREVTDSVHIRLAIVAAKGFPELLSLIPPRAPDANNCDVCAGTGEQRAGDTLKWLCNACGGVGWRDG